MRNHENVTASADVADLYARYVDLLEDEHDEQRKDALKELILNIGKELQDSVDVASETIEDDLNPVE